MLCFFEAKKLLLVFVVSPRKFLSTLLLLSAICAVAQTTGDYRSDLGFFGSGNWSDITSWQRWNGAAWVVPTVGQGYPGQNASPANVSIQAFQFMTLDVTPTNAIGNLTIGFIGVLNDSGNPSLTINNDLTINIGAVTLNGTGSLSVGGNTNSSGNFTDNTNGGTLTFTGSVTITGNWETSAVTSTGNLIFKNGVAFSGGTFNSGGATFNTNNQTISGNGDMNFGNTVTVTGVTVTNNNTGIITMSNGAAGTLAGTGTWTQGNNSSLTYAGQTLTVNTFAASASGNTVSYNRAGNQTIRNPTASTYRNLTASGSGTKTLSAPTTITEGFAIQNTAIFSMSAFDVSLAGNWTNSSTNADPFTEGTRTVTFNGPASQTISNTGDAQGTEFYNVVLNNTFGTAPQFTLSGNAMTVRNTLTMTRGVVNQNGQMITIGVSAASPGSLSHGGTIASGYMYGGSIRRFFATGNIANGSVTGLFPTGTSANFRPLYVSCPSPGTAITTGGSMTLSYTNSTSTTVVSITDGAFTIVRRHDAFWAPSTSGIAGGGSNFNLRVEGTGFGVVGNVNDLRICLNASVVGTAGTNGGTTVNPQVNRTGLTLANLGNQFHVGSVDGVNSPLPIQLISFKATVDGQTVRLTWATASEHNNAFFTVERSRDGVSYQEVAGVEGAGESLTRRNYEALDSKPYVGISYYRLKQTDFSGTFTYSEVAVVQIGNLERLFQLYPNPSSDQAFINVVTTTRNPINIRVIDYHGATVFQRDLEATPFELQTVELLKGQSLSPGLYLMLINDGTSVHSERWIIQ